MFGSRLRNVRMAFASNLRTRNLRRAQFAFGAAWTSEWMLTVGLAIVAFRAGGASEVGLVALLRLAPSALTGPVLAALADRIRRERAITAIGLVRGVAIGLMAGLLGLGASVIVVYALAVVATIAGTPLRAAHSALLPSLCTTPEELTSANAVRGMLDSLSTLVGPLLAALLLGVGSLSVVFLVAAGASAWSGLAVVRLDYDAPSQPSRTRRSGLLSDVAEGVRALASQRAVATFIVLGIGQTFTRGCLNVLAVVMALDVFRMGAAGVGLLSAAVGAGAVIGSIGSSMLVGSARLSRWFGVSIALWGLPLVVIGAVPHRVPALALLAVVGVANALLDVSGFSVMPRLAPDEILARMFGIFEALVALTTGLGSVVTPLLISLLGVEGALVAIGLLCPLLAAIAWTRLGAIDASIRARDEELANLRAVPILQPLPVPVMDRLGRSLTRRHIPAGQSVFAQGDEGDAFYVIAAGEAEVLVDGESLRTLGSGSSFGEIALLRDIPRTSEVRAMTSLELYAVHRRALVDAINGHRYATATADALIARMLENSRRASPHDL